MRRVDSRHDLRRVWRGYRQSELDAQYDQSTLIADPAPWHESWRDGSEQARRRRGIEVRTEIAYGSRANERFDLYRPEGNTRVLPFAAFVHGGAWRRPMRADAGFPALSIVRLGFAFVAIGVDGAPEVDVAGQADQVRRAWRHLLENADRLAIDPARGHLLGHCSGAHLAALAAFDTDAPGQPVSTVLLSGIYDLEPVRLCTASEVLGLDRETSDRLSPIRMVRPGGPSMVIAWGDRELDEFRRQSQDFAAACRSRGLSVLQQELHGYNHFDTSLELANAHSPLLKPLRGNR